MKLWDSIRLWWSKQSIERQIIIEACLLLLPVFLLIVVCISLSGCASAPKPIEVEYNCPVINFPADPIPATRTLTDKSTPDEVVKAWVSTAVAYRGWNKTVREQIEDSQ